MREWWSTGIKGGTEKEGDKTKLMFTHEGLAPEVECYKFCMPSWEQCVKGSLYKLITTGEGTTSLEGKTIEKPGEV